MLWSSMTMINAVSIFARTVTVQIIFISVSLLNISELRAESEDAARLESAEGSISIRTEAITEFKPVTVGASFKVGDYIHVGKASRASVLFVDGVLLRLAENTTLQFQAVKKVGEGQGVHISEGRAHLFSRAPEKYPLISTPAVSTAIRGTEIAFEVSADRTVVTLLDGKAECLNDFGSVLLSAGERVNVRRGEAPVKEIVARPKDAVEWALYYPFLLSESEVRSFKGEDPKIEQAVRLGQRGEYSAGLQAIGQIKSPTALTLTIEAALSLALGRVEYARTLLERSAKIKLQSSEVQALALAQQSIIAVAQGDNERAQALLAEARQLNQSSPSVTVASAYEAQSRFDLEGARQYLAQAAHALPADPYPVARQAELALGAGSVEQAQLLVNQSLALSSNDTYSLIVQGFIYLVQEESKQAADIFERVITQDSSSAMAYLGRGLARINRGDLADGRADLERAAFLDPGKALYRSYLGKAYFEEERESMAEHEYEQAIALDPRDPTPFLYRAYNRLSRNESVAALKDVEQSIALNNNRAVYRSSFLLDQDLGARSASLAEVFNSLGFSEAARIEAIKSISRDYGNFAGHSLLSQSYRSVETDDAGDSEAALATVLAPLNFNLLKGGSSESSLNEYNSLFNRNQNRTEIGVVGGSQDDIVEGAVSHSAKQDKIGYAASINPLISDGSKRNSYGNQYLGSMLFQYQPTFENRFSTEVQGVYRRDVDPITEERDERFRDYSASLNFLRKISAQSKVFAQVSYNNQLNDFSFRQTEQALTVTETLNGIEESFVDPALVDQFSSERIKSTRITSQYIFDGDLVSSVLGAQLYHSRNDRGGYQEVLADNQYLFIGTDTAFSTNSNNDITAYDLYSYNTFHPARWVDLTLGATYSDVEVDPLSLPPYVQGTYETSRINPKFGVTLYPTDSLTLRSAYFESVRKSSIEDKLTLEPSLVGGINQLYLDDQGALSRNVGVGIDYKESGKNYYGVEGLHRNIKNRDFFADLAVDLNYDTGAQGASVIPFDVAESHITQESVRGYWYHVLSDEFVTSSEYQYALSERGTGGDGLDQAQLHKGSLTGRYILSGGWSFFTRGTWREQTREDNVFIDDGVSSFFTVDSGLSYRLPNRRGGAAFTLYNILDRDFTYDQSYGVEESIYEGVSGILSATYNF